jgi:CRP-like cAMP-binding protein
LPCLRNNHVSIDACFSITPRKKASTDINLYVTYRIDERSSYPDTIVIQLLYRTLLLFRFFGRYRLLPEHSLKTLLGRSLLEISSILDPRSVSFLIHLFVEETIMPVSSSVARQNLLLNKLTDAELQQCLGHFEIVESKLKDMLCQQGQPIEYNYFPCGSVISNLIYMEDGLAIEVGTIGNESFSGVEVLFGATEAIETAICQIAGVSLRVEVNDFKNLIADHAPLQDLLRRAGQAYLFMVSQTAACNRLHHVDGRFARWLLITHDRVKEDEFPLTQEFLAMMLGVQRPSVNVVAGAFQQAGIVKYTRGKMRVLDRERLEEAACECYGKVRRNYERLLDIPYG